MTLRWVLLALVFALVWAYSPSNAAAREVPSVCKELEQSDSADAARDRALALDEENADADDGEGIRFNMAGACAKLTAGVSFNYQNARNTASGLPLIVNPNGTVSTGTSSRSVSANIGLETVRRTALGDLKTTVSAEWSRASDDGTSSGTGYVSGWSAGMHGLTVGYTGTLMSFWGGDFLSGASSPGRSATTVVYEYKIDDQNRLAVGLESNLPTTPQSYSGIKSFDFSDPVYTARWLHESDAMTVHASGLVRRADFSASPLLPRFADTATVRTGWAASLGLKLPVSFIAEDDEFAFQATYAVDATSYLGTSTDLVIYQHTVRSISPTIGWSAVGSFHHVWSEQFESNVFASYVTFKADLLLAKPEAHTFRSGINLFWKPVDKLKFGIEFGTVEASFAPNGVLGIFDGASGRAYTGYLSVSAEL
jgi:hypothetical protein